MTETELLTWEEQAGVTVPLDYRAFLKIAGRGGAGPDYGLFALPDPSPDLPLAEPFPYIAEVNVAASLGDPAFEAFHTEERGCLTLSHGGCGYYSFLIITGAARGQVWADGRVTDQGMKPIFNRFTDWYEDWLRRSIGECRTQGGSHG